MNKSDDMTIGEANSVDFVEYKSPKRWLIDCAIKFNQDGSLECSTAARRQKQQHPITVLDINLGAENEKA